MRFACIERDNHALVHKINSHIVHAFNFHERPAQLSHSLMVTLAFRGDFNRFQDRVIGAFREKGIGWIRIAWSCGVHRFLFYLSNVRQTRSGRLCMLVILNGVKDLALDCGSHKLTCVIGNHRWGPSLALGMTASSRAIGSSTRQTFSARIF